MYTLYIYIYTHCIYIVSTSLVYLYLFVGCGQAFFFTSTSAQSDTLGNYCLMEWLSRIPTFSSSIPHPEMTHHKFVPQVVPPGLLKYRKVSDVMLQKWTLSLEEIDLLSEKLARHEEINKGADGGCGSPFESTVDDLVWPQAEFLFHFTHMSGSFPALCLCTGGSLTHGRSSCHCWNLPVWSEERMPSEAGRFEF